MSRPVVGVTAYVEPARFTVWETTATLLPHAYVEHVAATGGQTGAAAAGRRPASLVDRLDALVLSGGGDMNPATYGAAAGAHAGYVRDFRDAAELVLVRAALRGGLPFLGVCRGSQVLNVALGGTLHQHVPDVVGDPRHCTAPGVYNHLPVTAAPGSRVAKAIGTEPVPVSHYHPQAVDRLGDGLTVTARSDDGVVEAAELDGDAFAVGVQWHPEAGEDAALFAALVEAAS